MQPKLKPPFFINPVDPNEKRNKRRRLRYASDDQYQVLTKRKSRVTYRKSQSLELTSCLRSLDFYTTLAKSKNVLLPNGNVQKLMVLSIKSVADCLGKIYQTIWRWVRNHMIPAPVLFTTSRSAGWYHVEEVRILIEEIGSHEREMIYYRYSHRDVRVRIFSRIQILRKQWQ